MGQWVEDEIVLPNGPFAKQRYRHHRHPVSRLYFDAVDSGLWSRVAATGPTQNGKTLMCYVAPVLYQLFELGETVIVALPSIDMANDKWTEDFLPVIEASQYRHLLPSSGEGSKGGQVKRSIKFRNGAVLRFMTAGGDDKSRSGFTSRVVAFTEVDGMDEASASSREADKVEQIEARTQAFGRTGKRVYMECTVSYETGRIWREYQGGTCSRIVRPCPYCGEFVSPEREHLHGWQDAESEEEAAEKGQFVCPACSHPWTESDRSAAANDSVLIHRGQSIDRAGVISGDLPRTQTLGFRWSGIDNPFQSSGDLGAAEWLASRDRDKENAAKKMLQFVWCMPYEPPEVDLTPIEAEELEQRTADLKKGVVPDETTAIVVGIDTGKRALHWTALAIGESTGGHVIEYGEQPVDSDRLGVHRGLVEALGELRQYFDDGWSDQSGKRFVPSQVWVDSGYSEHRGAVYEFCADENAKRELNFGSQVYRPTKGYGEGQRGTKRYVDPSGKRTGMLFIGTQYHIARVLKNGRTVPNVALVHMSSDYWKSELHQRLAMPADSPLAVTFYEAASHAEHAGFAEQLTAESQIEQFVRGRGEVVKWERVRRKNHYLDSTYAALCAGEAVKEWIEKQSKKLRRKYGGVSKLEL
ncbi:terminase gpA endonuclease subunit [Rhodopirellula baltica]